MNILVTGAKGFVGRNLIANLKNIQKGKEKKWDITIHRIFEYDIDSSPDLLDEFCAAADFVFHLAGVNRPKEPSEFMSGNFGFTAVLLDTLKKHKNQCPVMLSSSVWAALSGRYAGSGYGESKRAGEQLFFEYGEQTGVKTLVYRFPNLFGKWCRPNYNSVVATFCYNKARNVPVEIHDRDTELELVYIDDLIEEMLNALKGNEHRCNYDGLALTDCRDGSYCYVPVSYQVTLGEVADLLEMFQEQPQTLFMPEMPEDSFVKKLYSTYLSYLPEEAVCIPLKMNVDERGSFTELLRTSNHGQISVNVSKPGVVKGQHWHNSKWEFFIVVSGDGMIQERQIGSDEILEFRVSGKKLEAVHILPGYTHNIINLSDTENLITVMWANEQFDTQNADTYFEIV